jgi:hypothetical protein
MESCYVFTPVTQASLLEMSPKTFKDNTPLSKDKTCIRTRYKRYKASAHQRLKSFRLTLKQAENLFTSPCYYCGSFSPLELSGIDRMDNDESYTAENSLSCCSKCNFSKNTMSHDDFIELCSRVTSWQKIKSLDKAL